MSPADGHGIPWKELIVPQITNFTLFVGALVFLLRKPLRQHFSGKSEEFEEQRRKADQAKKEAELKNQEIRVLLKELEETSAKTLAAAEKDATALKEKMIAEAKMVAARSTEEAGNMVQFEVLRAVSALRTELIVNSTKLAEKTLTQDSNDQVRTRLNENFIQKVQTAAHGQGAP